MVGGLVQLGVFVLFGWLWDNDAAAMSLAAKIFAPVWLAVVAVNMWVGVTHAGYRVREEPPLLVANFLVPAIAAGGRTVGRALAQPREVPACWPVHAS